MEDALHPRAGSPVVVGVQRDDGGVAAGEMSAHPLDLVRMDVWRGIFHGRREIEDDLVLRRGVPHIGDRFAYLQGKLEFGACEAFRRVFEAETGAAGDKICRMPAEPFNALGGDSDDFRRSGVEYIAALCRGRGIVQVKDDVPCAPECLDRADDQILAALAENLDGDIGRDAVFLDEPPTEIELDLGS